MTSTVQPMLGLPVSRAADDPPNDNHDLRVQLLEAKATIMKLKQEGEEYDLSKRKSATLNQDSRDRIAMGLTGMGTQQQTIDGVPVQIVAALCLLSFLLAFFFF